MHNPRKHQYDEIILLEEENDKIDSKKLLQEDSFTIDISSLSNAEIGLLLDIYCNGEEVFK